MKSPPKIRDRIQYYGKMRRTFKILFIQMNSVTRKTGLMIRLCTAEAFHCWILWSVGAFAIQTTMTRTNKRLRKDLTLIKTTTLLFPVEPSSTVRNRTNNQLKIGCLCFALKTSMLQLKSTAMIYTSPFVHSGQLHLPEGEAVRPRLHFNETKNIYHSL